MNQNFLNFKNIIFIKLIKSQEILDNLNCTRYTQPSESLLKNLEKYNLHIKFKIICVM